MNQGSPSRERERVTISRILHAGYIFDHEGVAIAFDPVFENPFSRNCYAFPDLRFDVDRIRRLNFAAVFISHHHDDHCSLESLQLLGRQTPIYAYCVHPELFTMLRQLGFVNVFPLVLDHEIAVGPYRVIPRRALDADVDSMFHVRVAGLEILNVVDAWIDPETLNQLSALAPWDLVMWPFQTLRELEVLAPTRVPASADVWPPEWDEPLRRLDPRALIPSSCQFVHESWSWYNRLLFPMTYRRFGEKTAQLLPRTELIRLDPGQSLQHDGQGWKSAPPLEWVQELGPRDVDYDYHEGMPPMATAEIARQFGDPTPNQVSIVTEFCTRGIRDRYSALDPAEAPYFATEKFWRLQLYDGRGLAQEYHYRVKADRLEPVAPPPPELLGWVTELPTSKLFAALNEGESLTSIYLRVNAWTFTASTERELADADVLQDPLIRCLFTVPFGAYQAAQLKRIMGS